MKLLTPLKKSLRSREQIRAYVIKEMNEDKDAEERYAGERSAEAFGLLPKGFDLDTFMIDLLTEQIAGLYDPKTHEFYVADWIPIADQKMVMAHELTHALQDQHFQIEKWVKAARPNDDAELAREVGAGRQRDGGDGGLFAGRDRAFAAGSAGHRSRRCWSATWKTRRC